MDQYTVLIADGSESYCTQLQDTLRWICNVRTCTSGIEALSLLAEIHPDVLVLDLMLPGLDGISVLKALHGSGSQPLILASTCLVSDYIIETAQQLNVSYLMVKPCDVRATAARIQEQLQALQRDSEEARDLDFRISGLLLMMGFSVKLHGFKYLREAISRILLNPDQSITKELYPDVGRVYGTAGSHVERSIRGALADAWKRRDDRVWQLYFPADSQGKMKKPTNAVFITRIADGLRISLSSSARLQFIPASPEQAPARADSM